MGERLAALALLVLLAAGCAPTPEPRLLRRHASFEAVDTTGVVDVAVFSAAARGAGDGPRLETLSRSAQSELIRSVSEKTSTLSGFLGALAPAGEAGAAEPGVIDRTRHRRRLVVSAERLVHAPATRLRRLRVALGLDPDRARFVSWDRFATRHRTVEVGEARLRRGAEGGLDLDLDPRGSVRELGPGALLVGRSAVLDEELRLRERALSTGVLRPDSLVLLQEGATGTDVSGNSVVEVEVDLADAPARMVQRPGPLFGPDGEPRPPRSVRLRPVRLLHAPALPRGLRASLSVEAEVRTVPPGGGAETLAEGDDRVRLLRSRERRPDLVLVPGAALRASVWELTDPGCRRVLHRRIRGIGRAEALHFASAAEAHRFLEWLGATGATRLGRDPLLLGPEAPLDAPSIDALRVRLLPLNWDPGPRVRCP